MQTAILIWGGPASVGVGKPAYTVRSLKMQHKASEKARKLRAKVARLQLKARRLERKLAATREKTKRYEDRANRLDDEDDPRPSTRADSPHR